MAPATRALLRLDVDSGAGGWLMGIGGVATRCPVGCYRRHPLSPARPPNGLEMSRPASQG
jgi:hypothetical protein